MSATEEAEKCVNIALKAIENNDFSKAERFLEKSMRIEQSKKAQNLLYKLDTLKRKAAEDTTTSSQPSKSKSSAVQEEKTPEAPKKPEYTSKQVQMCREILHKKDYYDILGVQRNCSEDDIKKSYKKLAIKFHPDKNRAPQAGEAFKKVAAAYACLTDPEKRKIYNYTGEEPGNNQSRPNNRRGGGGFNEDNINPEEIFNMFFGGMGGGVHQRQNRHYQPRGHNQRQHQQQRDPNEPPMVQAMRQFGPLLFVIFMSMVSQIGESDTSSYVYDYQFSFQKSYQMNTKLVTDDLKQIYFVSRSTFQDFQYDNKRKYQTDVKVENDLINRLSSKCEESKTQKQQFEHMAKRYQQNDNAHVLYTQKAADIDMSFCKTLDQNLEILEKTRKTAVKQQNKGGKKKHK